MLDPRIFDDSGSEQARRSPAFMKTLPEPGPCDDWPDNQAMDQACCALTARFGPIVIPRQFGATFVQSQPSPAGLRVSLTAYRVPIAMRSRSLEAIPEPVAGPPEARK
jgi:hypothetical protein